MKNLIHELVFGRNAVVSGIVAISVVGLIALGCSCGKDLNLANIIKDANISNTANISNDSPTDTSDDSVPSNSTVEGLVKDTTAQFADAIDSDDFSEIHSNASQDFQATYSVSEMKDAFKSYVDKKKIVLPVLNKVGAANANFSTAPFIRTEKGLSILVATGKFPTKPYNVRFEYEYVMRGGEWKLLKLVIYIP